MSGLASKVGKIVTLQGRFDGPGKLADYIVVDEGVYLLGNSKPIGGPTRIGHYFNPSFASANGSQGKVKKGPILVPGKSYTWSVVYDPAANHGNGEVTTTLGDQSITLALKPRQKAEGTTLDRFGFFTTTVGGQMVKIYFDDLEYTATDSAR